MSGERTAYFEAPDHAPNPEERFARQEREVLVREAVQSLRPTIRKGARTRTDAREVDARNGADAGDFGGRGEGAIVPCQSGLEEVATTEVDAQEVVSGADRDGSMPQWER